MYRGFQLQLWESSILFKSKERQNFYVSFVNSTPKRSESNSLDREDHSWRRLFLFSSYKKRGIGPLIFQISNCTFLFNRASSFSPIESSYTSQILSHSMTLKRSFMRFWDCHKSSVLRPFDQNCPPPSWNNFWNFFSIELLLEVRTFNVIWKIGLVKIMTFTTLQYKFYYCWRNEISLGMP